MLERWRNEWIVLWHVFFLKFYSQRVVESMCLLILLQNYSATPEKSLSNSFSHRRSQICLNILSSTFFSFPGGSDSKQSACNVGDLGSIPGLGRSLAGEHGKPLQYRNPYGQRSLVGCNPRGRKELNTTEWLSTHTHKLERFQVWERLDVLLMVLRCKGQGRSL